MDTARMMDVVIFAYSVIISGLRCFIEADFLARFLRVKARTGIFILYISACYLASFLFTAIQMPLWVQSCVHFLIMFLAGMAFLNKANIMALAPCIIATTLFALADGLDISILRLLIFVIPRHTIWGLVVTLTLSFLLLAAQYYILKYISTKYQKFNNGYVVSYLYLLLLPCLLTIIMIHFNWGLWEMVVTIDLDNLKFEYAQVIRDTILLFCAALSFAAVLAAFYKLMEAAGRESEKTNLEQQIKTQQQYVAEAKQRNEQYRSFQHDISNHFTVLSGLVSAGKNAEAAEYLQKIRNNADEMAATINTGNMILDVLLGEKIAYARRQGVTVTWDMQFDKHLGIDDFDLCILFANAMDNAIRACSKCVDETKSIQITSKIKNDFLFIEIENTCGTNKQIVWGVGLKNMKQTAEKYNGTVNTQISNSLFRLSILLCLPTNRKSLDRSRD